MRSYFPRAQASRSGLPFYVLFSPLVPDGMVLPEILSEQELKLLIDNMSLFRPNS